jgi:hypothetical protein
MKFLSDILVKAGLVVENTFSANAATNTIYAGTGTRLRTEANNLVFERVSSSGTMKMMFTQGTLSPTAKAYIGYSNATLNLILSNEYATAGLELRTSDIIRQQIFANGNIVIGQASPVDAGYKVDITGTVRATGVITASILAGTGTRMVVADSSGVLSTQAIVNPAAVLPVGGTTGQILAKIDNTNYNTEWIDNYTGTVKHVVKAGVALTKGQAVYVSSADGTNMIVSKASNAGESTSSKTMGLIAQSLNANDSGYVVTEGLLSGIDTSTAQAGDPVWLGTDGNLLFGLANKPYAPNHMVYIGVVTRVQQNNGEIFVKVQNGFELNELHDVYLPTYISNGILYRDTVNDLWKTASIETVLGYTPVTNARTLTINGTTYDLTTNRSWSVGTTTGSGSVGQVAYWSGSSTQTGSNSFFWDTVNERLGIGLTNPQRKIEIYSATADSHLRLTGNAPSVSLGEATTGSVYQAKFGLATASGQYASAAIAGDFVIISQTGATIWGTGSTERMRLSFAGNFIVGSSSDSTLAKLQINGSIQQAGVTSSMIKVDSNGVIVAASAGSDFVAPATLASYVPTSRTITINGVSYDLSADRSWTIAGGVTSFNTRTGAITLTSGDVTGALGYTPYNSSNPAGYITGYTETDTLASVTARGATTTSAITINKTGTLISHAGMSDAIGYNSSYGTYIGSTVGGTYYIYANGQMNNNGSIVTLLHSSNYSSFLDSRYIYATSNPNTAGNFTLSIGNNGSYSYVQSHSGQPLELNPVGNAVRISGNIALHAGNYNSYSPTLTGGGASGTWGVRITGFANQGSQRLYSTDAAYNYDAANPYFGYLTYDGTRWLFQVSPGTPAAVRVAYADSAGSASSASTSSQVSINYNNDSNANYQLLWGSGNSVYGTGSVYVNPSSDTIYAVSYRGSGNVGGTGEASNHPAGIFSQGTNWLYGTIYLNNNSIQDAANIYNSGWYRNYGQTGLYNQTYDNHIVSHDTSYWKIASANGIQIYDKGIANLKGYLYFDSSGFGLLNNQGGWSVLAYQGSGYGGELRGSWTSTSDMRAPIFYDSNDTSYYLDPNSTSNLLGSNFGDNSSSDQGIGIRYGNYSSGYGKIRFYQSGTNHQTIHSFSASWQSGTLQTASSGAINLDGQNGVTFGPWNNPSVWIDNGGVAQARGSFRAPIFYDSNDTGYYGDFASNSRFNGTVTNTSYFGADTNKGYANGYGTYSAQLHKIARITFDWDSNYDAENHGIFSTSLSGGYSDNMSINSYNDINLRIDSNDNDTASYVRFHMHTTGNNQFAYIGYNGSNYEAYFSGIVYGESSMRAPIFYDSNDTGFYLDPNSASNLQGVTWETSARIGRPYYWTNRYNSYTTAQFHQTGTNGWGTSEGTWANAWKGGFSGWDIWGGSTDHPQGSGYIHAQGIVSGQHYATSDGGQGYGWMMVGAHNAIENRYWLRGKWSTTTSGWVEMITTGNIASYTAGNVNSISSAVGGSYSWTGVQYFVSNRNTDSSNAPLQAYSSNGGGATMAFHRGGYYAVNFGLDSDNVMRIGGWSASANRWQLDMSGNMTVAGDVTAYSDARVKENVHTVDNALSKVLSLRGVYYNRTDSDDKKRKIGVIAQETLTVIPEVVNQDNDGMYNVSYGNLGGLFIEAFKEQQKKIEAQDKVIEELKSLISGITK